MSVGQSEGENSVNYVLAVGFFSPIADLVPISHLAIKYMSEYTVLKLTTLDRKDSSVIDTITLPKNDLVYVQMDIEGKTIYVSSEGFYQIIREHLSKQANPKTNKRLLDL